MLLEQQLGLIRVIWSLLSVEATVRDHRSERPQKAVTEEII